MNQLDGVYQKHEYQIMTLGENTQTNKRHTKHEERITKTESIKKRKKGEEGKRPWRGKEKNIVEVWC